MTETDKTSDGKQVPASDSKTVPVQQTEDLEYFHDLKGHKYSGLLMKKTETLDQAIKRLKPLYPDLEQVGAVLIEPNRIVPKNSKRPAKVHVASVSASSSAKASEKKPTERLVLSIVWSKASEDAIVSSFEEHYKSKGGWPALHLGYESGRLHLTCMFVTGDVNALLAAYRAACGFVVTYPSLKVTLAGDAPFSDWNNPSLKIKLAKVLISAPDKMYLGKVNRRRFVPHVTLNEPGKDFVGQPKITLLHFHVSSVQEPAVISTLSTWGGKYGIAINADSEEKEPTSAKSDGAQTNVEQTKVNDSGLDKQTSVAAKTHAPATDGSERVEGSGDETNPTS